MGLINKLRLPTVDVIRSRREMSDMNKLVMSMFPTKAVESFYDNFDMTARLLHGGKLIMAESEFRELERSGLYG